MTAAATDLQVRPVTDVSAAEEWSVERIVGQTLKIQECMKAVMKRDEHYGVIPGTNTKPTLLKPGAEKLCLMFRLCPEYEILQNDRGPSFISYTVRCTLTHIPTGARVATGLGSCNSREKKYTRAAPKKCPKCDKETIFRSKNEGEGWYCWRKKDGCGATFAVADKTIVDQVSGVEDPADLDNTLLKMGCKRSLVAAVLNGTAASDCFTQDLEDLAEKAAEYTPPAAPEEKPPKPVGSLARVKGAPRGPKGEHMPGVQPIGQTATKSGSTNGASGVASSTVPSSSAAASTPGDDLVAKLEASVMIDVDFVDKKTGEVTTKRYPKVTKAQLAKIHILKDQCRFEDEDWRGRLEAKYGKRSSGDLAEFQASDLIDRLQKMVDRAREVANDLRQDIPHGDEPEDVGDAPEEWEVRGDPRPDPEERT